MFKFILVFLFFLFLFCREYRKKKSILFPSVFLVFLYFSSITLSYPHVIINDEPLSLEPKYFEASLFFILLTIIYFIPFISYREDKVQRIVIPNKKILYIFSIIIVILSMYSILYFFPTVVNIFQMEDLNIARINMTEGYLYVESGIYNTIASVSASLYSIALILFFIFRTMGVNKKLSFLLLISSTSIILNVFAYVGRDGVVFWIFSFIGIYGLFKNFLPKKETSFINKILVLVSIITIPLFIIITIHRFSENPFAGILSYIGQPFPNFCLTYYIDRPITHGSSFPLFREILGLDIIKAESWMEGGTSSWIFGTLFKSFILNIGKFWTIILGLLLNIVFIKIFTLNRTRVLYFHQLFVYFLYYMIFTQGVFYFRQSDRGGNLFIIISFFLFILFLIIKNNHNINSIVLIKPTNNL